MILKNPSGLFPIIPVALMLTFGANRLTAQGGPPMITDDPATVGNGNWEINLLPSIERTRAGRAYEAPNIDINYGVGKRIQLKFEVPFVVQQDAGSAARSGFGNSNVGVRYRFIDEAKYGFSMS